MLTTCNARTRRRRRGALVVSCTLAALFIAHSVAYAAEAPPLAGTSWVAAVGGDRFVFTFPSAPGDDRGMSHSLRAGQQYTQCPFTVTAWNDPQFEFLMDVTGVRYRGSVDLAADRITGRLLYGSDDGMDLDLVRCDPAAEPGLAARTSAQPYTYAPPADNGDGWTTADAASVGLPATTVTGVVDAVVGGRAGLVHSVLVVRDGKLVCEEYFHGYGPDDLHPLASVTKSVSSMLVGVALQRGEITDLQAPVVSLLPLPDGYTPQERWSDVTLAHVLTMSIGLDWTDAEARDIHGTGDAFFAHVLGRGFVSEPGAVCRYVNANVNLLSGVLRQATAADPAAYAADHLFAPLGVTRWNWDFGAVGQDRLMDGSLQLLPRDMARLGQLMLQEGRWDGEQIVAAGYARDAIRPLMETDAPDRMSGGYGYLWWTLEAPGPDGPLHVAFANGWGSQFIVVAPQLDLVVVITGGNQDNGLHMRALQVVCLPILEALGAM